MVVFLYETSVEFLKFIDCMQGELPVMAGNRENGFARQVGKKRSGSDASTVSILCRGNPAEFLCSTVLRNVPVARPLL